jgi:hypothetical protein
MTHEYTLLVSGIILPGGDEPACEAVAWAHDTVLAIGRTTEIEAISRGDSRRFDLGGAFAVPWPAGALLATGEPASLDVLDRDPRIPGATPRVLAQVRDGQVISGSLRT